MRVFSIAVMASVVAVVVCDKWKMKYLDDFGNLDEDQQLRTPTGRMIAGWLMPNWKGLNMFPSGLNVWSNGYVSPSHRSPIEYESSVGGGWSELYSQRAVVGNLTQMLKNITDTSESDYSLVPFATFAPSRDPTQPTPPDALREALGMHPNISLVPWKIACSGDPGYAQQCERTLADAKDYLGQHVHFIQTLSVSQGDWVVFPTFLFGQRSDGTLLGVCSTEISTLMWQKRDEDSTGLDIRGVKVIAI